MNKKSESEFKPIFNLDTSLGVFISDLRSGFEDLVAMIEEAKDVSGVIELRALLVTFACKSYHKYKMQKEMK